MTTNLSLKLISLFLLENGRDTNLKMTEDKNKPKKLLEQKAAIHIGNTGTKLQDSFDVAIVIPTTIRPTLHRALDSIFKQDFTGRMQILIGIDKSKEDRTKLKRMFIGQPPNCISTILDLGYSTSVKHGGVRMARDGGSLRTVLSYLANSRYIAYLDDDNWWSENHISSLLKAIHGHDWAFSFRWFVDPQSNEPKCIDRWESTGINSGVFKKRFGGWVDPNCLLIDAVKCERILRLWSIPLKGDRKGMSADRNVFAALKEFFKPASTSLATCYYVINPDDGMHLKRLEWIKKDLNAKM